MLPCCVLCCARESILPPAGKAPHCFLPPKLTQETARSFSITSQTPPPSVFKPSLSLQRSPQHKAQKSPPVLSQEANAEFSQRLPIVGIVVTISPNFSLYKIVVLPAASNPTCTQKQSPLAFINTCVSHHRDSLAHRIKHTNIYVSFPPTKKKSTRKINWPSQSSPLHISFFEQESTHNQRNPLLRSISLPITHFPPQRAPYPRAREEDPQHEAKHWPAPAWEDITIKMRISFLENNLERSLLTAMPILARCPSSFRGPGGTESCGLSQREARK